MAEATLFKKEYISQDMFDLQIKHLRERADSDEKLSSARFDKIEALISRNMEEQHAIANEIRGEIKVMNERIDKNFAEYKVLLSDVKSELKEDISDVKGDVKAINARLDTLQNKFSWNLAWVGIIMGLVLAIVQHFWK